MRSLTRTAGSSDETETGKDPILHARTASGQLGLRGYVLWLTQAPSEKLASLAEGASF